MNISKLYVALKILHISGVTPFIIGRPGVGKSSVVKNFAKVNNFDFIDLRAVTLDASDLGIPFVQEGIQKFAKPFFVPSEKDRPVLLFLDEFPQAPTIIQNTLSEVILDKSVKGHKFRSCDFIVAAGNRPEDNCATFEIPDHIRNRVCFLELQIDGKELINYFRGIKTETNYHEIGDIKDIHIHKSVADFLSAFPNYIYGDPDSESWAFATPRSWEFAGRILSAFEVLKIKDDNLKEEILRGVIGSYSIPFMDFLSRELPFPPQNIFENKEYWVPDDFGTLNSVIESVVEMSSNYDDISGMLVFLERVFEKNKEIAIRFFSLILKKKKDWSTEKINQLNEWNKRVQKNNKEYIILLTAGISK